MDKKLQPEILKELLLKKMFEKDIINLKTYENVKKEMGVCRDDK